MSISTSQAEKLIDQNKNNPNFKVIDVRTSFQRWLSRIPNSQHVPLSDLGDKLQDFKKEETYLIYCRSGARSASATQTLKEHGINAINMAGGMNNWGDRPTEGACEIY